MYTDRTGAVPNANFKAFETALFLYIVKKSHQISPAGHLSICLDLYYPTWKKKRNFSGYMIYG